MPSEKMGVTQWGTQFVLGSLREFIDEGVETPGLAEALKSRRAAMLKAIIETVRLNLPRKPKFDELSGLPPPVGAIVDLLNVNEGETIESSTEQFNAILRWLGAGITFSDKVTAVMVSRKMGVDP